MIISFRPTARQEEKLKETKNRTELIRKALDAYLFSTDDRIKELDDRIKTLEAKIDRILSVLESGDLTLESKKEAKQPESAEKKDLLDISSYIFDGIEDLF
ncbi:hypothetical protein [Thermicanus aegyptius]|uniref:hypothetical protein n=1 Tax=Thermicanus aegyptius TaxID=94009 RepID=UPI00041DE8B0|nr:hypothetical protein [Thermicanus aegyptius]